MRANRLATSVVFCAVLAGGASPVDAQVLAISGDSVCIHLHDGRELTGNVDARTDRDRLWLRITAPSITIFKPIQWSDIVRAQIGDRQLTPSNFRELAPSLRSELPTGFFETDVSTQPERPQDEPPALIRRKVRSLQIYAHLANWDDDVNVDGLELRVFPGDENPTVVPVNGMLQVQLIGQFVRLTGQRGEFGDLGRWTRRVQVDDFGFLGAVYRLPFRGISPEFDRDVDAMGLVHASLGVAGQGNFEASVAARIRTSNPIRDQLWLREHTRFFPIERTNRRKRR